MFFQRFLTLLCVAGLWGLAATPPNTSQITGSGCNGTVDTQYVTSSGSGCPYIITKRPGSWDTKDTSAQWIGPAADATGSHQSALEGNFIYTLTFTIAAADIAKANLDMRVWADPDVDIVIKNSKNPDGHFIPGNTNTSTGRLLTITSDLAAGINTIQFLVSDIGSGPVGLKVSFTGDIGGGASSGGQPCTSASTTVSLQPAGNAAGVGTGTNQIQISGGVAADASFCIIASDINDAQEKPVTVPGPSIISNPVAGGWGGAISLSSWVSPTLNQSNAVVPGSCCGGLTTYQANFTVPDISVVDLLLEYQADDTVAIALNGVLLTDQSGTFNAVSSIGLDASNGLQDGLNTLTFGVKNVNGPTGLDVNIRDLNGLPPGKSSGKKNYSLDEFDPVDSTTGQFYEVETDLRLGGIVPLNFSRYYSSALAASQVGSALGPNWMSNFDMKLAVSGNSASVLMFTGKVLTFTLSSNVWQIVLPADAVYQLAQSGTNYQLMHPVSKRIYTFNSTGKLVKIEDRNGNSITITRGTAGPTSITDGNGRTLTFTYKNGMLTKIVDQAGHAVSYGYTGGVLTSFTDANGSTTTYAYTNAPTLGPLMTKKTLPLGNVPVNQTYDAQGRVLSQTDGNGNVSKLSYDSIGNSTGTDPAGNSTKYASNSNGVTTQLTDAAGGAANFSYDSSGRRTTVADRLGNKTSFAYQPQTGMYSSATDAAGNATTFTFTSQVQGLFTFYNLTKATYADGTSSSASYDTRGNGTSTTAPDGGSSSATFDSLGRVTKITDPAGQSTTYSLNSDGTLASTTNPLGDTTTWAYDAAKQVASVTTPNGGKTSFTYDAAGRLLSTTDPVSIGSAATVTTNHYDANGQRDSITTPSGGVWSFAYTPNGSYSSMTDPLKNKTTYAYDNASRLSSITDALGEKVAYSYDAAGRVTSVSDNNGVRRTYTYTPEIRLATSTDATGRKTSYAYDALGRVTGVTTSGGNQFTTAYDKLGRVASTTNPLGESQSFAYDTNSRITQINSPGGIATSMKRDSLGRLTSVTSPNGNAWTLAYDAMHLNKITDPLGNATTYTYTKGQLASVTYPLGTVTFTNDLDGRVLKRAYSDGTTINASYDANGLMVSGDNLTVKRDVLGNPTTMNGIAITFDAANRQSTMTYAGGKVLTYTYDNVGRVANITDWVGGKTTFTYDAAGRFTGLTYPNGVASTYAYDADGRLSKITMGTLGSISVTRDGAGKITSANRSLPVAPTLTPNAQTFSYNAASQLAGASYDKMGRVTSENSRTYNWNLASELTSFNDSVDSATLTYDALGGINSKTASGATQTYVMNYASTLPEIAIVRTGNSDLRYYIYTPQGMLLYSIEAKDNSRKFYHFDEMGNTAFLTNDAGTLTDSYGITPYGEVADHVGAADNPFTWQGQFGVMQEARGLYYMRSRHYDASAARFLSPDQIVGADPRSAEPYVYANSNPMGYVDPMGDDSCAWWDVICHIRQLFSPPPKPNQTPPAQPPSDPPVPIAPANPPLPVAPPSTCDKAPCGLAGAITLDPSYTPPGGLGVGLTAPANGPVYLVTCSDGELHQGLFCSYPLGPPIHDVIGVGLLTSDGSGIAGPDAQVVINGVSGIISHDGGTIISHDGGTLIGNSGSTLVLFGANGLVTSVSPIISDDSEGIVASGGGNIVASGGGNIVASGGGNIVASGGGNIVASGGGNIVASGGGN